MWEHNVLNLIVASLVGGAVCGALWDFFRIQRILFGIPECVVPRLKDKNLEACVLVALQDLLFLVLAACVLAVAFYYGNNGNFQLYALAFAALGMTVYLKTVGVLTERIAVWMLNAAKKVAKHIKLLAAAISEKFINLVKKVKLRRAEKKSKRQFEIGKYQNSKIVGGQGSSQGAFHKSKSHSSR